MRMFASDFLDEAGFKVFEAVNADEALAVLQARPDVQAIVTDIEMPGAMNGIELAKAVRERWPGVRIVIISGRSNPSPGDHLPDDIAFPQCARITEQMRPCGIKPDRCPLMARA